MPMRGSTGTAGDFFGPETFVGDFFGPGAASFWLGVPVGIPPLQLAGKILIEILSTFSHALEDFGGGQRRDKQYREKNAYGFQHGQLSSLRL